MKQYTGINIQYPISQLILNGTKTVETRTYPLPPKYVNKPMLIVETPGKAGTFKSRIVAIVVFGKSFQYNSKAAFYRDSKSHHVTPTSLWAWEDSKPKWGWPIEHLELLDKPRPLNKLSGIVYTKDLEL